MECASLMPIDLFFEAPRPMDSCNFPDDHTSLTRDVRLYNVRLYSTYTTLSTYERWKRIVYYSTHEELKFVNSVSVVKPNKIAVAFNNAEL